MKPATAHKLSRLLLLALCLAGNSGCDTAEKDSESSDDTAEEEGGSPCTEVQGYEAVADSGSCSCELTTACLEGIDDVGMSPAPACIFETETQLVVSFLQIYAELPVGWERCDAPGRPEACDCCEPLAGCQATE